MKIYRVFGMLILSLILCSCAGKQVMTPKQQEYASISHIEGACIATVRKAPKVASGYKNIVLDPLQISPQYTTDYPKMALQFQTSMISYLRGKKAYKHVEANSSNKHLHNGHTLIVDVKVISMRIVSPSARFWAGAMAGSSYMDLYIKLIDASSKKVIHEEVIDTYNNAFASAWSPGSEQALPIDMGKIIGEYVYTVTPPM